MKFEKLDLVKEASCDYRAMNGYKFVGLPEHDEDAFHRNYFVRSYYELENLIGDEVDSFYDGYDASIYDTELGLMAIVFGLQTHEPLIWCKVEPTGKEA